MTIADRWLLPDGVEEILPPQAQKMECLRRQWLDLYRTWGYEFVEPPLIEFVESLLAGMGNQDLDLQTFKLIDQLTGRLMGVRADMTPQVARIDAHSLKKTAPGRLCYAGQVLHTRAASLSASRTPFQVGAELYGHEGIDSDVEVLSLMLETLYAAGCADVHVDIGHVGIYRMLSEKAQLTFTQEALLFDAMQRKATNDVAVLVSGVRDKQIRKYLIQLPALVGDLAVLKKAKQVFGDEKKILLALDDIEKIVTTVKQRYPQVELCVDLGELRGYHYHSGVMFAAYVKGQGQAIAKGGRYDGIGEHFGRARAATGFSVDMQQVMRVLPVIEAEYEAIWAPAELDDTLWQTIKTLRNKGEIVVTALAGQKENAKKMGCSRKLVWKNNQWVVVPA